jgi:MFS family permease
VISTMRTEIEAGAGGRPAALRTALAGLIGNVLEWFDFAVYGYFAGDIGRQFFPQSSATAQQLLAFAVFALGFFARPIGSLALGTVGDRIGRRALLTASIALMGGSTMLLGLLPTYQQIGVAAPVLLVVMRLIQGFSVGGEFTGSMVFTTEASSALTRGIVSSSTAAGVTIGFILGSGSAWLVNSLLEPTQVASWGWRVPFVGSIIFCLVGWFLRRGLHETAEGVKAASIRPPLVPSIIADWLPMLQTFGIVATTNAAYYLTFTYMVDRRKGLAGDGSVFLLANTLSLVVVLMAKPFGGWPIGQDRTTAPDDHPDPRHNGSDLPIVPHDASGHATNVRARTDPAGDPPRHGAGSPRRDGGRDLPAAHARDVDEHRLQRHPCSGGRHRASRIRLADRLDQATAGSRLLRHSARSCRPRTSLADEGD